MANLLKSFEVADHFKDTLGIPKPTMANWAKEKNTWRGRLYRKLEKEMIEDLAKQVKDYNV